MPPLSDEMVHEMWHILLYAVLPALVLAAVVMAVLFFLFGPRHAPLSAALGLIAGVGLGLWLHEGLTLVPRESSWNRLPWAALAALWIGRIARLPELQPSLGWFLRAATSLAIAWLVIPPDTRKEFDWLAPLFAAVVFAEWAILERLATDAPGGSVLFCLSLCLLTAFIMGLHAGWPTLRETSIVLASALAGLALVAWWFHADAGGAVPAVAVALPGLMLMGQQETDVPGMPWYEFALPALAPLILAEALPLTRWQATRWRFAVMLLLILIPLAAAFYLGYSAGALDFDPQAPE